MALHTILGANGTIATELIPVLAENKEQIRLVSRNPKKIGDATVVPADLLNTEQVMKAVEDSDIVYLLAGLEYNHKVWQRDWPVLMQNVINACKAAKAKLIFFDNVYPYGIAKSPITEETVFAPVSKKGKIRAAIDIMLLNEMKGDALDVIIARAADFYGPRVVEKSAPGMLVFSRMKKNKPPQWLANPNVQRSFSYTPDCAKAIYILSQHADAFNKTWILPSATPALTGKQFVALAAKYMHAKTSIQVLPEWLIGFIGLFNPIMKEIHEMMYQDKYGYILDSSKFTNTFNFVATGYEDGIKAAAEWYLNNKVS